MDDGATVQILYEGKTADTAINDKSKFDEKVDELAQEHVTSQMRKSENVEIVKKIAQRENRPFDDLMKELSAEEVEALKKKWGTTGDILEAEQRIEAIAADMVRHYIENILPNGFKAQVVCSSKMAAVHYKKYIDKAIADTAGRGTGQAGLDRRPASSARRRPCEVPGRRTVQDRSPF